MIREGLIVGKMCRLCGGPIRAIEQPLVIRSDERLGDDDTIITEAVAVSKYRNATTTKYEHVVAGYCGRCGMGYSIAQMEDGEPDPPMLARVGA